MEYRIDSLDRDLLTALREDSRRPYLEIARELGVSGGTIHQRMAKLKEAGIVTGSRLIIDYGRLGYDVTALVGIRLRRAGHSAAVRARLLEIPEITEMSYTTGTYSLLAKVVARNMRDLYELLSGRLQSFPEIQSTETFVILDTAVRRDPPLVAVGDGPRGG
ncbi:Lrp/AsnC ligand binding domain-containing protein [bacterium]|nr:Lrp/AsnC ligand binding domain-containing protein [bacterium]